jgi:hypothetical protein
MPHLETVFRDPTQPPIVRISALEALSFVAPVRLAPANDESEEAQKAEARERVRHVVELLGSFLPPPPGTDHRPHAREARTDWLRKR